MTARLVDGPIRERKTVVARFGAPEIMHTTIHGRVHLGAAAISRESNCRKIKFSREVISELRKH